MRSRYTAYAMGHIGYIEQTMKGLALIGFNELEAKIWSEKVSFVGLKILNAYFKTPTKAYVEFKASFMENYQLKSIHEKSEFIKTKGQWYYVDGEQF